MSAQTSAIPKTADSGTSPRTRRIIFCVIAVFVFVALAAAVLGLIEITLCPPLVPAIISLLAAIALAFPYHNLWQRLTGLGKPWLNAAVHIVFATVLFMALFYGINWLGRSSVPRQTTATVTSVAKETRYHTRRVRRGVYTRGAPYTAFVATINIGGNRRSVDISYDNYRGLRKGDTLDVELYSGLLGQDIIDYSLLRSTLKKKSAAYRRNSRRTPYTRHKHTNAGQPNH